MTDVAYPIGTTEYIKAIVTADITLDAQPVAISIDGKTTWLPGTWLGSAGQTRTVRTTDVYTFATKLSPRSVYVRVTDSSEIPIIKAAGKLSAS